MTQNNQNLGITADELNKDLAQQKPLLLFDLRLQEDFEKSHVEGSVHAVCDAQSKEKIMPKIPKNTKIILISDPEDFSKETASMMNLLVWIHITWKVGFRHGLEN